MNEEKRIHKFLNKEKDEKIYDVWVDRYEAVRKVCRHLLFPLFLVYFWKKFYILQ